MAVMKNGSIVQQGSPEEILSDPADEYVARFVQDIRKRIELADKRDSKIESLDGGSKNDKTEQKGKITNVS
jgi:glycine betaine/proline transport system ATP-binding protein